MANLKEIKTRIASVKSTQKITKAMKMVSAAKFRKAEEAMLQNRPYSRRSTAKPPRAFSKHYVRFMVL